MDDYDYHSLVDYNCNAAMVDRLHVAKNRGWTSNILQTKRGYVRSNDNKVEPRRIKMWNWLEFSRIITIPEVNDWMVKMKMKKM